MLDQTAIIMYSHSSYSDAWPMFIGQADKYIPECKRYLFADRSPISLASKWKLITYDDAQSYNARFASCLKSVKEEFVILHHEDMPLYGPPNKEKLTEYLDLLKNSDLHYIKLIKGGELRDIPYEGHNDLFRIPHDSSCIFAVQPTLWKTESLAKVYQNTKVNHIHDFEPKSQVVCKVHNIHGLYSYRGEPRRGIYHHDSSVYPYVATAIVKGKWNLTEYGTELRQLFEEYKIQPNKRGVF